MLVLTRLLNQVIKIGDDIEVKVLSINGGKVRLGVSAPRDVPVHREEVYWRVVEEAAAKRESYE